MFSPDFETERDYLAYTAWRHIERRRNELTPSEKEDWLTWYRRMFAGQLAAVRAKLEE